MATLNDVTTNLWQLSLVNAGEIVQGIDDIKQQIEVVLFTVKGSDATRPQFGCGLYNKIDKPINQVRAEIVTEVLDALQIYVPLIEVLKINPTVNAEGLLHVKVEFKIIDTVAVQSTAVTYGLTG